MPLAILLIIGGAVLVYTGFRGDPSGGLNPLKWVGASLGNPLATMKERGALTVAQPSSTPSLPATGVVHWRGVTLAPASMRAFQCAQQKAKGRIQVVSSYRSVAQQRAACEHVCGDPTGCSGTCAPPGQSCHQRAAAVDVRNWSFAQPFLLACGFCHPLPSSDSGHFSYPPDCGTCG